MPRHAFDSDFMAVNMLTPEERQAAGAGAEATDDSSAPIVAAEQQPQRPRQRLKSLDAVRGLNIMVMMFVDDADPFSFSIDHMPWNGVRLADFVMPLFLFM
jgi:heparan-alpha-glucosaminide N-acetyltransferase